jgi:hypothetical protein
MLWTLASSPPAELRFMQTFIASPGTAGIAGCVRDSAGKALDDAVVIARGPWGECVDFTDSHGFYSISNLKPGPYDIRIYYGRHEHRALVDVVEHLWTVVDADMTSNADVSTLPRALTHPSFFPRGCYGHAYFRGRFIELVPMDPLRCPG